MAELLSNEPQHEPVNRLEKVKTVRMLPGSLLAPLQLRLGIFRLEVHAVGGIGHFRRHIVHRVGQHLEGGDRGGILEGALGDDALPSRNRSGRMPSNSTVTRCPPLSTSLKATLRLWGSRCTEPGTTRPPMRRRCPLPA